MEYSICQIIWLFFIYAFLGWCAEVCFQALATGKIINRGFLNGPWCPIYGVGMVGVLLLFGPVSDNLLLLFLLGMALCTLVELVVGWGLEKIFHSRWWDYSKEPFQLGGYICLRFSLMWGLAVVFTVRLIHPGIMAFVELIPRVLDWILAGVLMGAFTADFIVTLTAIIGIKKELRELKEVAEGLHQVSDAISEKVATTAIHAGSRLEEAKTELDRKNAETRAKLEEAKETLERKNTENRQKLETKVAGSLQELQARQARLEAREKELREKLFTAPKFHTRRLTGAFPNLKKALQERHSGGKTE